MDKKRLEEIKERTELIKMIEQQHKEIENFKNALKEIEDACYKTDDDSTLKDYEKAVDDVLTVVYKNLEKEVSR